MSIHYLSDLHDKKKLFHGDIKPANIFICNEGGKYISSDSGGLTLLNDPSDKYFIQIHTPMFSSSQHKEAISNLNGETAEELLKEDKY